jgi:hypothetical protein
MKKTISLLNEVLIATGSPFRAAATGRKGECDVLYFGMKDPKHPDYGKKAISIEGNAWSNKRRKRGFRAQLEDAWQQLGLK